MDQLTVSKLRRHAAGFTPEAFDKLLRAIAASETRHSEEAEDEDDLFELVLADILPAEADEDLEGRIMLLLDAYFDLKD